MHHCVQYTSQILTLKLSSYVSGLCSVFFPVRAYMSFWSLLTWRFASPYLEVCLPAFPKMTQVSIAAADFVPADEACGNDEEELVMKRREQADVGTSTKKDRESDEPKEIAWI